MLMRYGLIGNCKTAALVDDRGSIDWCCLPAFDSASTFARLLDPRGGHFAVTLDGPCTTSQRYLPSTNILETTFDNGTDAFVLTDYLPRYREDDTYHYPVEIHRLLTPLRGQPHVRIDFAPQLNYAAGDTPLHVHPHVITATHEMEHIYLYSDLPLACIVGDRPIPLTQPAWLLLTYHEKMVAPTGAIVRACFEKTRHYWETWASRCRLPDRYRDAALRAALVLKLMVYEDTGAIIAAPTTSIPEVPGEERNWDYRYCWLRDASFTLETFKQIGHFKEAREFIHFLLHLLESKRTTVQIVYGISGRTDLAEYTLPHLAGYRHNGPVRVGNQAALTRQNDIFGEILNVIYRYYVHYAMEPITDEIWSLVKFLVHTTVRDWASPDAGIWEFRHTKMHFTFSKLLSWVALDRGIKIARHLGKTHALDQWEPVAEAIRQDIEQRGWNNTVGAYTQSYDSPHLDASILRMEQYGFLRTNNPRWQATVRCCQQQLMHQGFAFRYTAPDDFGKPRSAFLLASCWMAQALASIGAHDEATDILDLVLGTANHLGLLSEDVDPATGELLGNFPQAYSHMAVINLANYLSTVIKG